MNAALIAEQVERLAGAGGVRVALAASAGDGLVVHAAGEETPRAGAIAALFAAALRRAGDLCAVTGSGDVRVTRLASDDAQLLAVRAGPLLLIALAPRSANAGRLRIELLRAAEVLG